MFRHFSPVLFAAVLLGVPAAYSDDTTEPSTPSPQDSASERLLEVPETPRSPWTRNGHDLSNPEPLEGTIATGRPSFGTGTTAVPIGRMQVELGYTYVNQAGGEEVHSVPNTLLRFGLLEGVELRLSTAGQVWREDGRDGFGDLRVGAKLEIKDQEGYYPKLAVQPSLSIPLDGASESDEVDPKVQVAAAWSFGATSLLINGNIGATSNDTDTEFVHESSLLVGRAVTDKISIFAEHFAVYPGDSSDQQSLDAGLLYLLDDNTQLDCVIGFGLNNAASDFFVGAGISFRF